MVVGILRRMAPELEESLVLLLEDASEKLRRMVPVSSRAVFQEAGSVGFAIRWLSAEFPDGRYDELREVYWVSPGMGVVLAGP